MAKVFFATANVGSVFEDLDNGLKTWMDAFFKVVQESKPDFAAVHFQETGGKNYANCTDEIHIFFSELKRRFSLENLYQLIGFVDSEAEQEDQFTALSNIYFVSRALLESDLEIWNFSENKFHPVAKQPEPCLHIGPALRTTPWKHKEKFPQNFFPDFKWSRKGLLRTRWRIMGKVINIVNIHLFHDSCNIEARLEYPSTFAKNRLSALNHVLNKILADEPDIPLFIFGDFNFRLNTHDLLENLEKEIGSDDLNLSTKTFSCPNQEKLFKENYDWLRSFDFEVGQFERIAELPVNFHPTYPFDESSSDKFMRTRCPAWCDRVVFSLASKSVMAQDPEPVYNLIGSDVCMGDHKPVYLSFVLKGRQDVPTESDDKEQRGNCVNSRKERVIIRSDPALAKLLDPLNSVIPTSAQQKEEMLEGKCSLFKSHTPGSRNAKKNYDKDSISSVRGRSCSCRIWKLCFKCCRGQNQGGMKSEGKKRRKMSKGSHTSRSIIIKDDHDDIKHNRCNKFPEVITALEINDSDNRKINRDSDSAILRIDDGRNKESERGSLVSRWFRSKDRM